ncbi:MAG: hypothetical protein CMJ64_01040 [Planctomycetaceae bacterium]|nr:hypothetical protein [Planctomycetaceae bacterium]
MKTIDVDVVVLGSGFAGSLTAILLRRIGRSVALIDKARHPRFAIGESSTPIANMVLRDLAVRYDRPRLLPLCKYGLWRNAYPDLTCGVKRGFSYFNHEAETPFQPSSAHHNELLVAASADDEHSDTQWLRSDIDAFLCGEAADAGAVVLDETNVLKLERSRKPLSWRLQCQRSGEALVVLGNFLIDATGEAGVVPHSLGIESDLGQVQTHSRAIFSHFTRIHDWNNLLRELSGQTEDHPFPCDHAAQHHLLDGAWLWMLRFQNSRFDQLCSAGLVLDERKYPLDDTITPEAEWQTWLNRYPSIARMFEKAELTDSPGQLIRTRRLQRRWQQLVGRDWALLPHTAGFVDPLHSSGIAHSLCGIERLIRAIDEAWDSESLAQRLLEYEQTLYAELDLIDELVAGCFDSLGQFDIFGAYSMLYFAAATTYERQRAEKIRIDLPAFLCANDDRFRDAVKAVRDRMPNASENVSAQATNQFFKDVAELITPFNHVGLCDRAVRNMYRYTVAPM